MTFPSIVQHTVSGNDPASTTHNCALSATATAGNLLLVVFVPRNYIFPDAPDGWRKLVWETEQAGGFESANYYVKISDGTEDGLTFTTASTLSAWFVVEIANWSGHLPTAFQVIPRDIGGIVADRIGSTSSAPNPRNLNPSVYGWADTDTLWLGIVDLNRGDRTISSISSGYTSLGYFASSGGSNGVGLSATYRELNAASEDPGAWSLNNSAGWGAITLAIRSADSPSHPADISQFLSEVGYSAGDKTTNITQLLAETAYSASDKEVDITQFLSEVSYSAGDKTTDITQLLFEVAYVPAPGNADWYYRYVQREEDMAIIVRQSTNSQTIVLGPFIDDFDFKTPETALTIANTDIKLSKNGATAVDKDSGGATALTNGEYAITLNATDTNTIGELRISCVVAGALPVVRTLQVVEEVVYDALYAVDAPGFLGDSVTTNITNIENILNEITGDTFVTETMNLEEIYNFVSTINTYVTAIMGDGFNEATDSLEEIKAFLVLMAGDGFTTEGDSLTTITTTLAEIPKSGDWRTISRPERDSVTYQETVIPDPT
jgi:hypothetical protein